MAENNHIEKVCSINTITKMVIPINNIASIVYTTIFMRLILSCIRYKIINFNSKQWK